MEKLKPAAAVLLSLVCLFGLTACNETTAKHEHNFIQQAVTEPTCTKQGYTTYTCECGASRKDDYTEPLGHDFLDNECTRCGYTIHTHVYEKTVIAPTCTEQGYTKGKCTVCGTTYTANFVDPLGHDFVDGVCTRCGYAIHNHEYKQTVIPPDCTNQGYTFYECIFCDDRYVADFTDPLGHDFADSVCTRCGETEITEGLEYTLSDDGSYYICSGKGTATANKINVPSAYNGKPVKEIGESAFKFMGIEKIIIPDSVTAIGSQAFYFCSSLTSVTFGNGITSIGNQAFYSCSNLQSLTIPDSVTYIGEWAFAICRNLESVTLPDKLTTISEYLFYNCANLTDVTIPDSVTTICNKAFGGCGMKSFSIPDGLTSIGDNAFEVCQEMTSITLPESLTYIGNNAFYNCFVLKDIFYNGTERRWAEVVKGNNWDLNVGHWEHSDYTLHFPDGEEGGIFDIAPPTEI